MLSRRDLLKRAALAAAGAALPLAGCARPAPVPLPAGSVDPPSSADLARLESWSRAVRAESSAAAGRRATRAGELAGGTPYEPFTLEAYIKAGGDPTGIEPIALTLTKFDCVTLVESCLALARLARLAAPPTWNAFAREVERMRYRDGVRRGYTSRLHYFSEWISDGERRGLLRDMGQKLGGSADTRPLRFMTEHRGSYPALASDEVFREIGAMERRLDASARHVVPTARIAEVSDRIESGDVIAFATSIPGLDVSHAAFAYRDAAGVLRVLHAPLSGGAVEVTRATLPEYVSAIRRATGILVARPRG